MACGKNHRSTELLASGTLHASDLALVVDHQFCDTGAKVHLATTVDDGIAHVLDDARQLVAANVRMSVDENVLAGPMLMKDVYASDLYQKVVSEKFNLPYKNDIVRSPVIV